MGSRIILPAPLKKGKVTVEEAIAQRRSIRKYRSELLTLSQLSQLLWASQGLSKGSFRTVPSAGATYPLEIFALVRSSEVRELDAGVYWYSPEYHSLTVGRTGDFSKELCRAALN